MARIIGGIGCTHAPIIAHAYDKNLRAEPVWQPLFDGFKPVHEWLGEAAPDLAIVVYNDHLDRFFFDAYPTFAIGVCERFPGADEGWGTRDLPDIPGDPEFAWHAVRSLMEAEFDLTVCQELTVDHGILSTFPLLFDPPWPCPILPLAVNVIQHPLPTARRLYKLGAAFRDAVQSYPKDLKVVMISTGGMSHQLQGTRFGEMNPEWDNEFLDLLEHDPEHLASLSHDVYMERGGAESVEMIMWLAMRGALGPQARKVYRFYYAPTVTAYGLILFDNDPA